MHIKTAFATASEMVKYSIDYNNYVESPSDIGGATNGDFTVNPNFTVWQSTPIIPLISSMKNEFLNVNFFHKFSEEFLQIFQ